MLVTVLLNSTIAIGLQFNILLGAAYALTGCLRMAVGLHMMWDFANDGIFGVGLAGQSSESIIGGLHKNDFIMAAKPDRLL